VEQPRFGKAVRARCHSHEPRHLMCRLGRQCPEVPLHVMVAQIAVRAALLRADEMLELQRIANENAAIAMVLYSCLADTIATIHGHAPSERAVRDRKRDPTSPSLIVLQAHYRHSRMRSSAPFSDIGSRVIVRLCVSAHKSTPGD